ncbi:sigma-70 family RNA polymerase sigma factor [Candidatus Poribacteria bacterium]
MRTEDGCIIHRCLNGEPGVFGLLVDKYKAGIYAYVYTRLPNFQDAQDVTQEVFLQAYRDLRALRRWESFVFWLYRIAHNYCTKHLQARSRRPDRESIEDQDPRTLDDFFLNSYRDNQVNESLREAIYSLPGTYRQVLMLHYFGGMNSSEIAKALGTSPTAIRMRLSRARAQLKEEMAAMMNTAFEGQRLQANFTFRVVEAVKRIKVNPMPRSAGLPWGLSLAAGIIVAVLALNPHLSIPSDMANPAGFPLPVETKVLETGEIPVDILKTSKISTISSKQGDGDGGEPQFQSPNNALMLAPRANGDIWTEKTDMPTARFCLSTCAANGKIYAVGGVVGPVNATSAMEEYDPSTDTWTKKTNMPTQKAFIGTCAVNGRIYVMGGDDPNGTFPNVEEYDLETDKWTRKANMPRKRTKFAICVVNGKIYAIGGVNSNGFLSVVEEYDPSTDKWTRKTDMPTARAWFGSAVANDKIYIIGGTLPPAWTQPGIATVEEYDPATDTWTKKADMPTARFVFAASALDGKIYVFGGDSLFGDGKILSSMEEYDPATDIWVQRPAPPIERYGHSSNVVDGKIYIIGGREGGSDILLSSVEEYIPGSVSVDARGKLPTMWGEVKSEFDFKSLRP